MAHRVAVGNTKLKTYHIGIWKNRSDTARQQKATRNALGSR